MTFRQFYRCNQFLLKKRACFRYKIEPLYNIMIGRTFSERRISDRILIRNEDEERKQPLVVVLGWGNCKMKQLYNYSNIFEKENFTSVCVTTTLVNSLLKFDTAGKKESSDLKDILNELLQNRRPLFFYIFSNGGLTLYYYIVKNFNSNMVICKNIKGTIFDSAPIVPNYESAEIVKQAFIASFGNNVITKFSGSLIKLFVKYLVSSKKELEEVLPTLENSEIKSPQLVLFSKIDKLAPYKDIQNFINARKERGYDISYRLWEDSKHVAHMKTHTDEYVQLVDKFIEHCLHKEISE